MRSVQNNIHSHLNQHVLSVCSRCSPATVPSLIQALLTEEMRRPLGTFWSWTCELWEKLQTSFWFFLVPEEIIGHHLLS